MLLCGLFMSALLVPACVTTAECDPSSPCARGEVCYEYTCRKTCEGNEECEDDEQCVSCSLYDSCAGKSENACIEREDPLERTN